MGIEGERSPSLIITEDGFEVVNVDIGCFEEKERLRQPPLAAWEFCEGPKGK